MGGKASISEAAASNLEPDHVGVLNRPLETMMPADVADRLGVSEACLAKWRMAGTGPAFVRVSHRRVVYPVPAFNDFMAARTRMTTLEGKAA
jgi:hypothetical protein